jgi:hypothetical protein
MTARAVLEYIVREDRMEPGRESSLKSLIENYCRLRQRGGSM